MNDWLADILDGHGVTTKRSVIQPISSTTPLPQGFGGAGQGRLVEFAHPVNMGRIVEAYARELGGLRYVMIAQPRQSEPAQQQQQQQQQQQRGIIRRVAICAGSGYDVLKNCSADLFVTGEMSHHNALRLTMLGKYVITVFHSNSERGFLKKILQPKLVELLRGEKGAEVLVSDEDEDPFEIWDVQKMPAWAYDKK